MGIYYLLGTSPGEPAYSWSSYLVDYKNYGYFKVFTELGVPSLPSLLMEKMSCYESVILNMPHGNSPSAVSYFVVPAYFHEGFQIPLLRVFGDSLFITVSRVGKLI